MPTPTDGPSITRSSPDPLWQKQIWQKDLYNQLCRVAHRFLRRRTSPSTLQTRDLVGEAYLRLANRKVTEFRGRTHFLATASAVIRQVLQAHERARKAHKRGGGKRRVELTTEQEPCNEPSLDLMSLRLALRRLQRLSPRQCRVVELRFFGGMTEPQIADALGITERTVQRDWVAARAWLQRELQAGGTG